MAIGRSNKKDGNGKREKGKKEIKARMRKKRKTGMRDDSREEIIFSGRISLPLN
jgi:hypothetical protein